MEPRQQPASTEDKGSGRAQPHPEREPLARAKTALKERMLQRLRDDVLAEFSQTEVVAAEAHAPMTGAEPAVRAARSRFKERLLQQAFAQAVDEVPAAAENEPLEAPESVMEAVRASMKAQLLYQAFQDVITELADADVSIQDFEIPADLRTKLKASFKSQILESTDRKSVV